MAAGLRLLAFLATAIGIELGRGAGLVTLAGAALVGLLRRNPLLAVLSIGVGAALSLALPEDSGAVGKVAHGLSNLPVLIFIHGVIGLVAFGAGRLVRALRG